MGMKIRTHVPLRRAAWFQTGGPATWFCEPRTDIEFQQAIAFARGHGLAIAALGEGANVLVSDNGFDGLAIRPRNTEIVIKRGSALVRAGAGASVKDAINTCLGHRLLGIEEFSGIPGTIGGAVFINIHYFEHLLSELVVGGRVIDVRTGEIEDVSAQWFAFGYDRSRLHEGTHLLVDATFRLRRTDAREAAYAMGRRDEIIRHRERRYPTEKTCGSFFQNFTKAEVAHGAAGAGVTNVAYYLDQLGVKGTLRVGDALVSPKHANMIVNCGNATSADIARLARRMQDMVRKRYGLVPRPECRLIGFKKPPLL